MRHLLWLSAAASLLLSLSCSSGDADGNEGIGGEGAVGDGSSTSRSGASAAGRSGDGRAGGTSGGSVSVGGSAGNAGSNSSTGGAVSTGGTTANGGSPNTGGSPSTAGSLATGGAAPGCTVDLNCNPAVLASTGDFAQDCVNRINQFRVGCHCMGPLERWTEGEVCAEANAEYDQGTQQAHSGWGGKACEDESGPLSSEYDGWATNECPGWESASSVVNGCMKLMYGEGAKWAAKLGRNPTQADYGACSKPCYAENGHFIAMTKASHTHVACGIYGEAGDIWSVQNFK